MSIFSVPQVVINSRSHVGSDTTMINVINEDGRVADVSSSSPTLVYCVKAQAVSPVEVVNNSTDETTDLHKDGFMLLAPGCDLSMFPNLGDQLTVITLGNDRLHSSIHHGQVNRMFLKDHLIWGASGEHVLLTTEQGVISILRMAQDQVLFVSDGPIWGVVLDGYCTLCTEWDVFSFHPGDGFLIEPGTCFRVVSSSRCDVLAYRTDSIRPSAQDALAAKLPVAGVATAF